MLCVCGVKLTVTKLPVTIFSKQAVCLWCQTYGYKNSYDNMLKQAVCLLCQMYGHKTSLDNTLDKTHKLCGSLVLNLGHKTTYNNILKTSCVSLVSNL